ncbi:MAG: prolipoprotein diacylglyceryl transferase [Anaerolineales bacterium]|nr:prolipoprotein diacylglyceryl transferase [Anaerolineales bacterium]
MITQPFILDIFPLYSIILTCSAALGLGLSAWMAAERKRFIVDAGIGLIFVSLLGARIGYVFLNFSFFRNHASQIPQIWLGGLSWPGALMGAGAALLGIHLIWKEPLGELADSYLPLVGTVAAAIWMTGWGAGVGYGPRTSAWFGIPVRDLFGVVENRWPLPILGTVLSAGWITGLILLPLKQWNVKPGWRAVLGFIGIVVINGIISVFRVDPSPLLWGLRGETWFSIALMVCIVGIILNQRNSTNDEKTEP